MTIGPASKADRALDREVPVGAVDLHFRVDAFNLFNTVNYATPNRFVNTPQFGTITEAATAARQIQFVIRATFERGFRFPGANPAGSRGEPARLAPQHPRWAHLKNAMVGGVINRPSPETTRFPCRRGRSTRV